MNTRRLAGDVGAEVPRVARREQREVGDHVHVRRPTRPARRPSPRSRRCRSSRRYSMQSAIQSTCCSIDTTMLVSTDGLPGPEMVNRFGKPGDPEPEVGARARAPTRRAALRRRARGCRSPAARRSSRRSRWRTRWQSTSTCSVADVARRCGVIALDRRRADVDELDVGAVERLEVAGVDAQPLAADHLLRRQQLGDRRVVRRSRRILPRTNSAAVSLAVGSISRSVNAPRNGKPPLLPARLELARRAPRRRPRAPTVRLARQRDPKPVAIARLPARSPA